MNSCMFQGVEMGAVADYSRYKGLTFQFTDTGRSTSRFVDICQWTSSTVHVLVGFSTPAQTGIFWRPLLFRPVGC